MAPLFTKIGEVKASIDLTGRATWQTARVLSNWYTASLLESPKYDHAHCLTRSRLKVFSQFGQDGVIGEIFRRIGSGTSNAVEIGVAPLENNTSFLLLQGWRVSWLDPGLPFAEEFPPGLREYLDNGSLHCEKMFLTKENALEGIRLNCSQEIDLLAIDIDYNTYHVFEVLLSLRPRVICVEYNSHFPASVNWIAPYRENAIWDYTIIYGASLKAFEEKAGECGYALVGCELSGTDAFFVRNDLVNDKFLGPYTSERHWEPPRFFLDHDVGWRAAYVGTVIQ